jgi:hypothetical protein
LICGSGNFTNLTSFLHNFFTSAVYHKGNQAEKTDSAKNKEKPMKKLVVSLLLAGVIVAAFGFVSTASAQGPVDQPFYGRGGARGGLGNTGQVVNEDVHNLMIDAWSTELGISVTDLEARIDDGERLAQIALGSGLSFEDFRALKTEIHTAVAEKALAAGYIDQAQYDWMLQAAERQASGFGGGYGMGSGTGYGMRRGGGQFGTGLRVQDGSCLVTP